MTEKHPVNTKTCKPIELYSAIGQMLSPQVASNSPRRSQAFVSELAVAIAKDPSNYYRSDDAHALSSDYLMKNEYATPWPLSAQVVPKNIWLLLCAQILGDIIEKASLIGWYEQIGRPITLLTPEESRKYNWDAAIVESGLKLGILLENLIKLRSACEQYKQANATAEQMEVLTEMSLSRVGVDLVKQEVGHFANSLEATSSRAFSDAFIAAPTGREVIHPFRRSY